MSFLYRTPILIARKQPYIDWANSTENGEDLLPLTLARQRDVYLAPYSEIDQTLEAILEAMWEEIFEAELLGWSTDAGQWPTARTLEMFQAWFDVELAGSVIDLTPDDVLTEEEVDLADVDDALVTCAWCEREIDEDAGRIVPFQADHPDRLSHREGLVLALILGRDHVARGIVTPRDSAPARENAHLMFRACSRRCEKELLRRVPRALRDLEAFLERNPATKS